MPITINIFILAMTKNDIDDLDINLDEFDEQTQAFIKALGDNRYFDHEQECKPFHNSDSIRNLIEKVFKEIKEYESGYDIQPYIMDSRDVGSTFEAKYDFLIKEHIRIIDSLSLISKRIKSMGELLQINFKNSCLVLCCEKIPQTLREKLKEMTEKCFPYLCIHEEKKKYETGIKFDIHTVDSFIREFGLILKAVYSKILAVGKPIEGRVEELGTRQHISLKSTSLS